MTTGTQALQIREQAHLASAPQASPYVAATDVAELLGVDETTIRRRCYADDYDHRYTAVCGTGGRRLEVAVASLAPEVQVRALARIGAQGEGHRAQGEAHSAQGTEYGDTPPASGSDYDLGSPAEKSESDRRLGILTAWWTYERINRGAPSTGSGRAPRIRTRLLLQYVATARAAPSTGSGQALRISKSSILAWEAAYTARGLDGLLPSRTKGGRPTTVSDADSRLYLSCWGVSSLPAITVAYNWYLIARERAQATADGALRHPGPPPTLHAIRYLVDHLSQEERLALRGTPTEIRAMQLPFISRDYESILPLEWACMDHKQFNILGRDPIDGRVYRVWLTGIEDLRSRKVVIVVTRQPAQDSVLYAIAKACMVWGGVPRNLYLDNGKDFRAKAVTGGRHKVVTLQVDEGRCRSLCDRLGMVVHFANPFNAQAKPIERFFLTMQTQIEGLFEHFTGADIASRPEGLPDALARDPIPSIFDIERVITGWIERDYHNAAHRGDAMHGRSPNQLWDELLPQTNVRTAPRDLLRYLLLPSQPARVGRSQVTLFGQAYVASAESPTCLYGYTGQDIRMLYDPQDMSQVFAVKADDETPIGYLVLKSKAKFGIVSRDDIRAANHEAKKIRSLNRATYAALVAERSEADPLIRVQRRRLQAGPDAQRPLGLVAPPPNTTPHIAEIIPISPAVRAAAARTATPPAKPIAAPDQDWILPAELATPFAPPAAAPSSSDDDWASDFIQEATS
jgi:hypothetical protein